MYCSTCGKPVTSGLSYCNHCGAKLGDAKSDTAINPPELFPDSLIWAIVTVFIIGLGGSIGLMAVMKDAGNFNPGLILGFTLLPLLIMLAVEGVLIWLLLSRKRATKEAGSMTKLEAAATRELPGAEERRLTEPPLSVTDQTTRTLDSKQRVPVKVKSDE